MLPASAPGNISNAITSGVRTRKSASKFRNLIENHPIQGRRNEPKTGTKVARRIVVRPFRQEWSGNDVSRRITAPPFGRREFIHAARAGIEPGVPHRSAYYHLFPLLAVIALTGLGDVRARNRSGRPGCVVEGTPAFVVARFVYKRALLAQAPLFEAASAAKEFFRSTLEPL
jgi:hypothetical protein